MSTSAREIKTLSPRIIKDAIAKDEQKGRVAIYSKYLRDVGIYTKLMTLASQRLYT